MHDYIPPLGAYDIFRNVENWSAEEARYWAGALDQRADESDQAGMRAYVRKQSGIKSGDAVLEIGCGTGRFLVDLARAVGASGHVIGLEPQPFFIEEVGRSISEQNLAGIARVLPGRADEIPLPDVIIDICFAQTVLIHIPADKLAKVFAEVKRVLKSGGTFISVDQDGDTRYRPPDRSVTVK
jgi:ubiquinone/menaquinone biosynthesis C-methylase UbiE